MGARLCVCVCVSVFVYTLPVLYVQVSFPHVALIQSICAGFARAVLLDLYIRAQLCGEHV